MPQQLHNCGFVRVGGRGVAGAIRGNYGMLVMSQTCTLAEPPTCKSHWSTSRCKQRSRDRGASLNPVVWSWSCPDLFSVSVHRDGQEMLTPGKNLMVFLQEILSLKHYWSYSSSYLNSLPKHSSYRLPDLDLISAWKPFPSLYL